MLKSVVLMLTVMTTVMTWMSANVFANTKAEAESLSSVAIVHRCYAHLTGKRMPMNHSILSSVKSGSITATQACDQLVDRLAFNGSSTIANANAEIQKDAEAALNHLTMVNRSYFGALDFCVALPDGDSYCMGQHDLFDTTVPALALTEPIFNSARNFSHVFTLGRVPKAERTLVGTKFAQGSARLLRQTLASNANRKTAGFLDEIIFPDIVVNTVSLKYNIVNTSAALTSLGVDNNLDFASSYAPESTRVKIGKLQGIVYDSNYKLRFPSSTDKDPYFLTGVFAETTPVMPALDLRRTIDKSPSDSEGDGGGIIASQEYLMLNFGWTPGFKANGVVSMPRRWTQSVFKEFFCRDLPVLRDSDGKNLVVNTTGLTDAQIAKVAPFRLASNCTACHGTMDQMAAVLRNVTWHQPSFTIGNHPGATTRLIRFPVSGTQTGTNTPWRNMPVEGTDTKYHLQNPTGRLFYRSYDGRLIDQSVNNASHLAQIISQQNDVYVCAAKKYFKQFTGIDVPLHDIGDPANASLNKSMTEDDWAARDFVIQLGIDLKSHQKISRTIKDILKSNYFTQKKIIRDAGGGS